MTLGNGSIGTNVIFGDSRKRNIELIEDDWTSPVAMTDAAGATPHPQGQTQDQAGQPATSASRGPAKRMKGGVSVK